MSQSALHFTQSIWVYGTDPRNILIKARCSAHKRLTRGNRDEDEGRHYSCNISPALKNLHLIVSFFCIHFVLPKRCPRVRVGNVCEACVHARVCPRSSKMDKRKGNDGSREGRWKGGGRCVCVCVWGKRERRGCASARISPAVINYKLTRGI